ncbi:hypothetical protein [Neptunicella marina]|uniref:MSHA biogenesis protein MshF n=1 Tax=Neptunicella marina TaxID=2125989 RepID=A0A8J6ITM8_9ALTE|nr:hypothetical protein [Neptunicella marina]MBC3766109.1 hypothetical protein [Neptunicella marina]
MDKNEASNERLRTLFIQIVIVLVILIAMTSLVRTFYHNEPDLKKLAMGSLATTFGKSVVNAHWQWQAEGQPIRVLLVQYDENGKEVNRTPIPMSHLGWPKLTPNKKGCEDLWHAVLDIPMRVASYMVIADYIDGVELDGSALDSMCRYRLSTGPYFDYKIYTGKVIKTNV